jgi:hypothetical protein
VAGYPSYQEVIHLVQDGNIMHLPALTSKNAHRAQVFLGYPPGYMRGKMTKKKVSRGINNEDLVMDRKKQVLHFDT